MKETQLKTLVKAILREALATKGDCQKCKGQGHYTTKLKDLGGRGRDGVDDTHIVSCDAPGCKNGKSDPRAYYDSMGVKESSGGFLLDKNKWKLVTFKDIQIGHKFKIGAPPRTYIKINDTYAKCLANDLYKNKSFEFKPENKVAVLQITKNKLEESSDICSTCNGSGEGRYEGSKCLSCRGSGSSHNKKTLTKQTDPNYDWDSESEERKLGVDELSNSPFGMNRRDRRDLSQKLASTDTSKEDRDAFHAADRFLQKTNPSAAYKIGSERQRKDFLKGLGAKVDEGYDEQPIEQPIYKDRQGGQDVYWMDNRDSGGKIHIKPEAVARMVKRGHRVVDINEPSDQHNSRNLKENDAIVNAGQHLINGQSNNVAASRVNKILASLSKGLFSDNSWEAIHKIYNKLQELGLDVTFSDAKYGGHADTGTGMPKFKEWQISIPFTNKNGRPSELVGTITAHGAGSVEQPLDKYDITAYVSAIPART